MLQNSVTLPDAKKPLPLLYMSFWGATIVFKHRICLLLNKNYLHIFLTKLGFLKWFKHINNNMIYPVQVGFMPSHAKEVHFSYFLSPEGRKIYSKQPNIAQKDPCRGSACPLSALTCGFL